MSKLRKAFREDIKKLKQDMLKIGSLVEAAIGGSLEAVERSDLVLAEKIMNNDTEIDRKTLRLEERGMIIAATQFPVAKDLRLIYSIIFLTLHLERMGDLAFNIAKSAKHLSKIRDEEEEEIIRIIREMGEETLQLVHLSLKALEENNVELAREMPVLDEKIDELYKKFFKLISKFSKQEHSFDWAMSMILITRYLERIADHAVDIGERVTFIVTGEHVS